MVWVLLLHFWYKKKKECFSYSHYMNTKWTSRWVAMTRQRDDHRKERSKFCFAFWASNIARASREAYKSSFLYKSSIFFFLLTKKHNSRSRDGISKNNEKKSMEIFSTFFVLGFCFLCLLTRLGIEYNLIFFLYAVLFNILDTSEFSIHPSRGFLTNSLNFQ